MKRNGPNSHKLNYAPAEPAAAVDMPRAALTLALLAPGVALVLLLDPFHAGHPFGLRRWFVVALAVAIAVVPPVSRAIMAALNWARHPSPRARAVTAAAIAVLASAYFLFTAVNQGRDLFPKTHDDQSYYLQMQMLAEGRLWMPQHELADFFDTFYVLNRPKYASLYFPGAALLYVPTIWLNLPTWLMPIGVAGAIVGLLYRVLAEMLDAAAGLLAALLMASLSWFRVYSVLLTSHEPMLLIGLLLIWAWLRWRKTRHAGWFVAIGILAGWGAITRPVDALCFAIPVALAVARDIARLRVPPIVASRTQAATKRVRCAVQAAVLVLCSAAPFLALQAVFNHGVTSHWLQTPYSLYLEQDQPNTAFGFHPFDKNARPQSTLRQKQDYYQSFFVPFIQNHQPEIFLRAWGKLYAPMIADVTLPALPLAALLPLGLIGLTRRGLRDTGLATARGMLLATLPLFVGLYMLNTFFLEHYAILIAPAIILLLLSAGRALQFAFPAARTCIAAGFAAGLAILAVVTLPELNTLWVTREHPEYAFDDETFVSPVMQEVNLRATKYTGDPAVILFPYTSGDPTYEEPVYNNQSAWPDDARVIFAHDLGPQRDREIYAYYARIQPDREFYRFNRAAALTNKQNMLEYLGTARTLEQMGRGSDRQ